MRAFALLALLCCCGSPAQRTSAAPPPPPPAPPPSASTVAREPTSFVLFESLDAVPEAFRRAIPAKLDFASHVLAGQVGEGNAVQVIVRPAKVEEKDGVLHVVAIVHHVLPRRRCTGGIPPKEIPGPGPNADRIGDLAPNFLVVLDRTQALRARTIDVKYAIDVEDTAVSETPNAPCPPYP